MNFGPDIYESAPPSSDAIEGALLGRVDPQIVRRWEDYLRILAKGGEDGVTDAASRSALNRRTSSQTHDRATSESSARDAFDEPSTSTAVTTTRANDMTTLQI